MFAFLFFKEMTRSLLLTRIDGSSQTELGTISSGQVFVGREPDDGIAISSPAISRNHGVFLREKHHWFFKDLGSTNGSWLNGRKLESESPRIVKPGDSLQLADVTIHIGEGDSESGEPDLQDRCLVVLARNSYLADYPVPEYGRALAIGGTNSDLKLDVDIYELPSLVIERRGSSVCAYSVAKDVPVLLNGVTLEQTKVLQDRDELSVGHYIVIFIDAPETVSMIQSDLAYEEQPPSQEEEENISGQKRQIRTKFGQALSSWEESVESTVTIDPKEAKERIAGAELHPAMRYSITEPETGCNFESLENKILIAVGVAMFIAVIALVVWWLMP